jgi:hypothetical protein
MRKTVLSDAAIKPLIDNDLILAVPRPPGEAGAAMADYWS